MLLISKFHKSFGSVEVFHIEELLLAPGVYWVKGENGSGKSTLFRAIAGIIDFKGNIVINAELNSKKQTVDYRKLINFAEAEPLFPEFLTGQELIKLFEAAKNAPTAQSDYYVEDMQKKAYINEPIGAYSSGMLKKLSIVLAFLGNPQLILLDEPLITIDADSLKIVYRWIEHKHLTEHVSFLISSHQPLEFSKKIQPQILLVDNKTAKLC